MFNFIRRNAGKIILLLLFFSVLYLNTFHEEYPDEYDNILGGKYIIQGILPYSGFFSHHGPVAYFLSGFLYLFSGQSFVNFRIIYSIFLFLYLIGTYGYIRKSVGKIETNFYLFFLAIVGIGSTYFWGHMFLADSLSAYFIIPVVGILILKVVYKKLFTLLDLVFISLLLSLGLLSSLTIVYLVFAAYVFCFYFYLKSTNFKNITGKSVASFLLIMGAPYIVFMLYLLVTQSFQDYIYQNIVLNQKYYIYNYPSSSSGMINPVRYAIVIFHNFYFNFTNLLFQFKDFNFGFPFNITLALSGFALTVYAFIRKNFALAFFLIFALIYSNARSNPLDSSEKDYQAAVYIMIALFSMCFFLSKVFTELKEESDYRKKLILSPLFLLVGLYSFFNVQFLYGRFQDKVFQKYMGNASLIYDRPELAPTINKIVGKNDYVWIGPLEFKEYLYTDAKIASKYHFLIPAMGRSEKIKLEMLNDFKKNRPKVIFFDPNVSILGSNPQSYASFFIDFLKENYITLYGYQHNGLRYVSANPISHRVDLEAKMYINKNNVDEIITKLLSLNLIKQVPSQ